MMMMRFFALLIVIALIVFLANVVRYYYLKMTGGKHTNGLLSLSDRWLRQDAERDKIKNKEQVK